MATAYHLEALRRQRIIDRAAEAKRKLEEKEKQERPKLEEASTVTENSGRRSSTAEGKEAAATASHEASRASTAKSSSSRKTSQSESGSRGQSTKHSRDQDRSRPSTAEEKHSRNSTPEQHPGSRLEGSVGSHSRPSTAGKQSRSLDKTASRHSTRASSRPHSASSARSTTSTGDVKSRRSSLGHSRGSAGSAVSDHSGGGSQKGSHIDSRPVSQESRGEEEVMSQISGGRDGIVGSRVSTAELRAQAVRKDLQEQEKLLRNSNLVIGTVAIENELAALSR